jgi:hypothetical protein
MHTHLIRSRNQYSSAAETTTARAIAEADRRAEQILGALGAHLPEAPVPSRLACAAERARVPHRAVAVGVVRRAVRVEELADAADAAVRAQARPDDRRRV